MKFSLGSRTIFLTTRHLLYQNKLTPLVAQTAAVESVHRRSPVNNFLSPSLYQSACPTILPSSRHLTLIGVISGCWLLLLRPVPNSHPTSAVAGPPSPSPKNSRIARLEVVTEFSSLSSKVKDI